MVNISQDFCVIAVAREKSRLVSLNAMPTGRPTPLTKVAMEVPPGIQLMLLDLLPQSL